VIERWIAWACAIAAIYSNMIYAWAPKLNPYVAAIVGIGSPSPHFVSIADRGLVGALGESYKVSHVFQPDGRSCPSNSQNAFRFR
jgi:hypothetical protein